MDLGEELAEILELTRVDGWGASYYGNPCKYGHTLKYKSTQRCVECKRRDANRHYKVAEPGHWRATRLIHKFGISVSDYEAMLAKQNNGCGICGNSCSTGRKLAVDHDHVTGRVRGLLCAACNHAIGKFKDDPDLMQKAIEWVRKPAGL